MQNDIVFIRGAGDIASGIAVRLFLAGFKVVMSEIKKPSAIRREVSFCEAIYDRNKKVEDIMAVHVNSLYEAKKVLEADNIPVIIDEENTFYKELKPDVVVDAILAKKNLGTTREMADIVICVGPGFEAGVDCDCVVETSRGHHLGRVLYKGSAAPNTGIPGVIAGVSKERVIHSKNSGIFKNIACIGDIVKKDDVLAYVGKSEVKATIDGVLRGLLRDGYEVPKGFKIADIDPRVNEQNNCFTISDKARSIGGGALEAILHVKHHKIKEQ